MSTSQLPAARFAVVGAGGFGLQLLALHALTNIVGVDYRVATVAAVEVAVLHNFIWHERWTWAGGEAATVWTRLARFHAATAVVSIAGNVALTAAFVAAFSWPVLVANTAAVALLSLVNFALADRWIFASGTARMGPRAPDQWAVAARSSSPTRGAPLQSTRPVAIAVARSVAAAGLVWCATSGTALAADPSRDTVAAWDRYVLRIEERIARELASERGFLSCDFAPDGGRAARARVRRGELLVENVAREGSGNTLEMPDGMIHHWRGVVFVANASLPGVLAAIDDPEAQRALQPDDVLDVRLLERGAHGSRVFFKLQRKGLVSVAYNTEHDVRVVRHTPERASSRSVAVKIAELDDVGLATERERQPGTDRGFLWRMQAYWRFHAVPGGVVIELESLTLSRDLPWGIRAIARPILNQVARESLERTLTSLGRRAVALSSLLP